MKDNTMYLHYVDRGNRIKYDLTSQFTEKVVWIHGEVDSDENPVVQREPEEVSFVCSRDSEFTVAGKTYPNFDSMLKACEGNWGVDIHGREVFCYNELFPCFDSYDYATETRYYRWRFIREGNRLSRVYASDTGDIVFVTEDVGNIEAQIWRQMVELGYCQKTQA